MKKNISINISGIIFHIEEDGYEVLKKYLESINKYFSTYDESAEIIADIENRIAEIFLSKLKDGKQVIHVEDIQSLMATMGSVEDFQAMENGNRPAEEETEQEEKATEEGPRRLFRDEKRKLIGGVASGISHYFGIDPLWLRLILIILFFNIVFKFSISGTLFIAYIIGWMIIPGSKELKEDQKLKKLYRDNESRVIGGVSAGLARYFGVEVAVIRLIFVLTTFLFFTGLITYVILWIITPEAKTITDKMQMEGQKITLGNIESSVKKSFNVEGKPENAFTKILLFPFRLIAALIDGLSNLLGPMFKFLAEGIRILFGVILIMIGVSAMFSLVLVFGVFIGVFSGVEPLVDFGNYGDFSLILLRSGLNVASLVGLFIVSFVPFLALLLGGVAVLIKRKVLKPASLYILLGIWFVGIAITAISVPSVIINYSSESDKEERITYDTPEGTLVFIGQNGGYEDYKATELVFRGHNDSTIQMVRRSYARGKSYSDAEKNAKGIVYSPEWKDSVATFNHNFELADGVPFRFQSLKMTVYLPYEKEFVLDESLSEILRSTIYKNGYTRKELGENNTWKFTKEGLTCLTCTSDRRKVPVTVSRTRKFAKGPRESYEVADFKELRISDLFKVYVTAGTETKVEVSGTKRQLEEIFVKSKGDVLEIKAEKGWYLFKWNWSDSNPPEVYIQTPNLEKFTTSGAVSFELSDLDTERLEVILKGASEGKINLNLGTLKIQQSGASSLKLSGRADELNIKSSGASEIKGQSMVATKANIDSRGASEIRVHVTDDLQVKARGASEIRYQGDPKVNINKRGASSVKRIK